jgi:hypothetical protein
MGHAAVKSHDARGEIYQANIMTHYKDPQVLGVTYCACMFDQGGNTLAKGNQNGFYDLQGTPREGLINAVTEINHALYEHSPTPATPGELAKLKATLFATWDKHSVNPHRSGGAKGKGKGKGPQRPTQGSK